jgi:hypothetical protein
MTYTAEAAIKAARAERGYRESGTNSTKFNRWNGTISGYPHGGYGYPWCATFQGWAADKAGGRANVDYPKTAGCAVAVNWFKGHGRWSSTPHVGDWVFYGPGGSTHVEMVIAVTGSSIKTIGGNTSGSLSGQYFNGDGVYEKTVSRSSSRIYGYGRPAYGKEDNDMQVGDKVPVGTTYDKVLAHDHYPASYLWTGAFAEARAARIAAEAGNAAIAELSRTVAALAADRGQQVDVDALVARITEQIERVQVRLDVTEEV